MTSEMRERVLRNIKVSEGALTNEFAKSAIAHQEKIISYWKDSYCWEAKHKIAAAKGEIEYFEAVIEVLAEQAATEAVKETVQVLAAIVTVANKSKAVRGAVATLANKLHRLNCTLSESFKRAWAFVKSFNGLLPSLS